MRQRRRDRAALGAQLRMAAAVTLTAWAAMWSWRGFTEQAGQFLGPLLLVTLAVTVPGALARWRRLPGVVVVALQVVVGGAATCLAVASRPWPGTDVRAGLSAAVDAANAYASPVPLTDDISVQPLLVVGGFATVLLVDLCAATLRRVPLAGLPLLTVYSVPISLIDRGLSWWVFAATAVGFLFMLFLQEEEHLSRWGRSLDGNTEPVRRLSASVRGSALTVGAAATAAAVLVPLAVPTFSFSVFDVGPGGGGGGDIEVTNPMADLRQDLIRGDDIDLVTIRTDDPSPDHLRISVLNRFTDNEWSAGDRDVPSENLAMGQVPLDTGALVDYRDEPYSVDITDQFDSRWLPTQAPINEIDAQGDWRYDPTTLDFIAGDDDLDTRGMSYAMTAAVPSYDEERILGLDTSASAVPGDLTELPGDLSPTIGSYARAATAGATSDFERAVLLNQWFLRDGGFTYALPDEPGGGVGTGELADFLDPEADGGRTGYCEQFAAAMAVMARELGIPARVAVGFLKPDQVGDSDQWVYSAHDLHAWTELYFPQAGWVLFDPTPSITAGAQPGYATSRIDVTEPDLPTENPSQSSEPTVEPTRPSASAPVTPETAPPPTADAGDGGGLSALPWRTLLIVLAALALVVVLVLAPRTLRRRQRERRLAGGPEAAWEELRATAVDLLLPWPEGRSPRETRSLVVTWFAAAGGDGVDQRPARGAERAPEAAAALGRVVGRLERVRYSRGYAVPPGSLRADVELVCEAMTAGATPRLRRRARWLPASVRQRRRVTEVESPAAPEAELVGARSELL